VSDAGACPEQGPACAVQTAPEGACFFWEATAPGQGCWVLAAGIDRDFCRVLDACGQGGGHYSGGGCYKWATSSCDRLAPPWP
jgi:hypothetical protein